VLIERCQTLLERSREWVGFEAEPFRNALSGRRSARGVMLQGKCRT